MLQELQNMIAAVEQNIITYKEMGDEKAVEAAEGMIAKFEEMIAHELDMVNY